VALLYTGIYAKKLSQRKAMLRVSDIRKIFVDKLVAEDVVIDKSGVKLIEVVGASFLADEESIFRKPNYTYIAAELDWYEGMSLSVYDLCGGEPPKIWEDISSRWGEINSNYGWCIYSQSNGEQYARCLETLLGHRESRRAIMIYTRPQMQLEWNRDGMNDFICTNAVQYLIRNGRMHAVVQMRSNDVVFGYINDRAWQYHVLCQLVADYNAHLSESEKVVVGDIHWCVGSLHVYERHFKYVV